MNEMNRALTINILSIKNLYPITVLPLKECCPRSQIRPKLGFAPSGFDYGLTPFAQDDAGGRVLQCGFAFSITKFLAPPFYKKVEEDNK